MVMRLRTALYQVLQVVDLGVIWALDRLDDRPLPAPPVPVRRFVFHMPTEGQPYADRIVDEMNDWWDANYLNHDGSDTYVPEAHA